MVSKWEQRHYNLLVDALDRTNLRIQATERGEPGWPRVMSARRDVVEDFETLYRIRRRVVSALTGHPGDPSNAG